MFSQKCTEAFGFQQLELQISSKLSSAFCSLGSQASGLHQLSFASQL